MDERNYPEGRTTNSNSCHIDDALSANAIYLQQALAARTMQQWLARNWDWKCRGTICP